MAKKPQVKPTYMKGKKPLKIALHDVITVLGEIEKNGHMRKFVKAAKAKDAFVSVDAETVNFIKDFFVQSKMHESKIGKHIVNARGPAGRRAERAGAALEATAAAPPRDRFDCHFGN